MTAGERVVPAFGLAAAMKQIKEPQRHPKKIIENQPFKESVEYRRAKKWIAHVSAPVIYKQLS